MAQTLEEFLNSIDDTKSTPLKQVVDRHLARNNLRITNVETAIDLSTSQTKRFLSSATSTRERPAEQLRQYLELQEDHWDYLFNKETRKTRTHQEFQTLRSNTLALSEEVTESTEPPTNTPKITRKAAIFATVGGVAITLMAFGTSRKLPPLASIPPDRPCTIDLRGQLNETIVCDEFGKFVLTGTSLSEWHTKASIVRVPQNWDVVSRHETWGEPNYSVLDEDKSGFVQLPIGDNFFGRQYFDVFDNADLEGNTRTSIDREISDKLQYLVIHSVGDEPLVVWEHDHLDDQNRLIITHLK